LQHQSERCTQNIPDGYLYSYANTHADSNVDADSYAYANNHAYGNKYADTDRYSYPDTNTDSSTHINCYACHAVINTDGDRGPRLRLEQPNTALQLAGSYLL
jgi:hypothetical protein